MNINWEAVKAVTFFVLVPVLYGVFIGVTDLANSNPVISFVGFWLLMVFFVVPYSTGNHVFRGWWIRFKNLFN